MCLYTLFFIFPKIAGNNAAKPISQLARLAAKQLLLADPTFDVPSRLDAVLGADIVALVLEDSPKSLDFEMNYAIYIQTNE